MDKRMVRRLFFLFAALIVFALPASAQEGLDLPADLYVLLNNGQIQRYGMGAAGVESLTPADLYIIDFGVDGLGERVAFRTESGLYVLGIGNAGTPYNWRHERGRPRTGVPAKRRRGRPTAVLPTRQPTARFLLGTNTPAFVELRRHLQSKLVTGRRFLAAEAEQGCGGCTAATGITCC